MLVMRGIGDFPLKIHELVLMRVMLIPFPMKMNLSLIFSPVAARRRRLRKNSDANGWARKWARILTR